MWIVISEPEDRPALWAYTNLSEAGLHPIEQVTPEELSYASLISYAIKRESSDFKFDLRDGRHVRSGDVRGILNRVTIVPTEHLGYSRDAGYAIQEFNAFFLGWLSSLDVPIINRPVPFGLAGRWRQYMEWIWLANISGLPTVKVCHGTTSLNKHTSYFQDDTITAVVAGGEVFGQDLPESTINGCITLSEKSKTNLLSIKFSRVREALVFVDANPFPDLRLGGDRIIKKIKQILVNSDSS